MLPVLLGIGAIALGYMLDDDLDKKAKKKQKKLKKYHHQQVVQTQHKANQNNTIKRSILFKTIKAEQGKLKQEKRELLKIRKTAPYNSELYHQTCYQIKQISQQIEHKQRDADAVRF